MLRNVVFPVRGNVAMRADYFVNKSGDLVALDENG